MDDSTLLQHYAESGSEEAFAEIVNRYSNMVYSVCMRRLNDPGLAQDATQAVFFALSRKAQSVSRKAVISGWLFKAAIFAAGNIFAGEERRKKHERETERMRKEEMTHKEPWEDVEPVLDSALLSLCSKDRNAVILRYFQDRSHAEIGRELNISEHASQKRVERAVEKLRKFFARRGITLPAAVLAILFSTRAVTAAPGAVSEVCASVVRGSVSGNIKHIAKGMMKMMMWTKVKIIAGILACTVITGFVGTLAVNTFASTVPAATGPTVTIIDTESFWRCRYAFGTEIVRRKDGTIVPIHIGPFGHNTRTIVGRGRDRKTIMRVNEKSRIWGTPPENWPKPDFDDASWNRMKGPFCTAQGNYLKFQPEGVFHEVPVVCLYCRGKFKVNDPKRTGDLRLSVAYYGGLVVWLNGKEITRAHMPKGKITPSVHAKDYPMEAYVDDQGILLQLKKRDKKFPDRYAMRIRKIKEVTIPSAVLRKGINVIALEVHRAPAPEIMFMGKMSKTGKSPAITHLLTRNVWWSRIGIASVCLAAKPGKGLALNKKGQVESKKELFVWNHPIEQRVFASDYGDHNESLKPIQLCGARNGTYCGQVVAGSHEPIRSLQARIAGLKTTDNKSIPATAIRICYARMDGPKVWSRAYSRWLEPNFEGLADKVPDTVPLRASWKGRPVYAALQPIWFSVRIPKDAAMGIYEGMLTITAHGHNPVHVPVRLRVVDWTVPDADGFHAIVDAFQSPDSVAMQYNVPMWSEKHWNLIEQSFRLLGEIGVKSVYVTAIRRTHLGNPHSMIQYVKQPDGTFKPDLNIAEKYIDLAVKHLGKIPLACLYCWEINAADASNFPSYLTEEQKRSFERKILISVIDPKTGKLTEEEGPEWGTAECRKFWKPVVEGMKAILAKHGLTESFMLGVAGDYTPSDGALEDMKTVSGGAKWALQSHVVRNMLGSKATYPTGYIAAAWGGHVYHTDPDLGRGYGWKNPYMRTMTRSFPRDPARQRVLLEVKMTGRAKGGQNANAVQYKSDYGLHGIGRMGADFWPVLGSKKGRKHPLLGQYPETRWGQLNIKLWMPALLTAGPEGPTRNIRFEMLRQNQQEICARVFLEKVLCDEARRSKIGNTLAIRIQELLDERTRIALLSQTSNRVGWPRGILASDVNGLSAKLYELTAEAAGKLKRK